MTAPRFPNDTLPPTPPAGAGGSLLEILRKAKYSEDFFGVDQPDQDFLGRSRPDESTPAPRLSQAVFHGASELPSDPSQVRSTLDVMRDDVEPGNRLYDQARAGLLTGIPRAVVDIPEFMSEVVAATPSMARRGLDVLRSTRHAGERGIPRNRVEERRRAEAVQGVKDFFGPVVEPARQVIEKGADLLAGAPQSPSEQVARVGGQLASGLLVPFPTGEGIANAVGNLGEAGAVGARRLARGFGRTNKGYVATTEVAKRLLEHSPDDLPGLAHLDDVPAQRTVEIQGSGKGVALLRDGDNLFVAGHVTPEHKAALTQRLVPGIIEDVRAGLSDPEVANGAGWYRGSIHEMEAELQRVYPELADPSKMAYAKLLIAMTSPENAPEGNIRQAMDIYARSRLGGSIEPSATAAGVQRTKSSLDVDEKLKSLEMVRQIFIQEAGGDVDKGLVDLIAFLQEPGPSRAGREAMPVINDLLGRKTSNFWMNLMGHDNHVTADVWAIRNARRHWGYQILGPKREPVPGRPGEFRTSDELTLDGTPTNPEYDAIEDAYRIAAEQISRETGQQLSPMDVQALTWYREKKLYAKGGAVDSGLDDLGSAARAYAERPTQVLNPETGDLALRDLSTPYGRSNRPKQIGYMDDDEALRRINAERNAGVRAEAGAGEVTDPGMARQLLLRSERGAVGGEGEKIFAPAEVNGSRDTRMKWLQAKSAELTEQGTPHYIKRGATGPATHIVIGERGQAGVEEGSFALPIMGSLAGGIGGGATGAAGDNEHPIRGAILGALLGTAAGVAGGRAVEKFADARLLSRAEKSVASLADEIHARPEGFSFDPREGEFVSSGGFMVGGVPGQKGMVVEGPVTPEYLKQFARQNARLLAQPGMMIGGWQDDGKTFIDVAQRVPDEAKAAQLIRERGEKAAWNLDKGEALENPDVQVAVSAGNERGALGAEDLDARITRTREKLAKANGEYGDELARQLKYLEQQKARLNASEVFDESAFDDPSQLWFHGTDEAHVAMAAEDRSLRRAREGRTMSGLYISTDPEIASRFPQRAGNQPPGRVLVLRPKNRASTYNDPSPEGPRAGAAENAERTAQVHGDYEDWEVVAALSRKDAARLGEHLRGERSGILGNTRGAVGATRQPLTADDYAKIDSFATDPAGEARLRSEVERLGKATLGDPKPVISHAETMETAKQVAADLGLGTNIRSVNPRLGGAEMLAIRNIVSENLSRLDDLVKRTLQPGGDKEADALIGAIEVQNDALLRKFIRSRSATGRDLNNLKILANANMDPVVWLAKADNMLRAGGKSLTTDQALQIRQFAQANDRAGMVSFISDLRPASNVEKALTLWKAGLLTSPSTHVANLVGNTAMAGLETAKDAPAALIDRIFSLVTGQRTKDFSPAASVQASFSGARAGLRNARLVMGGKLRPGAMKGEVSREVNFDNPILDTYTKTVFRALEASDQVFLQSAIRRSLAEQARVLAPGDKAAQAALLKTPTDAMTVQAIADAEYATFRESSRLTHAITGVREAAGTAGHVVAPFVKTPTNIAATVIDYSPAGVLRAARNTGRLIKLVRGKASPEEVRAVQRLASEQAGRAAVGALPIAVGYLLAKYGLATGAKPADKSEYQQEQLEGRQPNSININGDWRAVARFAPLGNLIALGANLYEIQQDPEQSLGQKAVGGAASIGTTLLETPFLQGVEQVHEAIADPKRAGTGFLENTAGSVIPNIVRRATRSIDPVVRDTKSDKTGLAGLGEEMLNSVKAGVPGLSSTLPARQNQFGEPLTRNLNILEALFDPTNPRPDMRARDSVIAALDKAGANVPQLAKKKGETNAQYRQRQAEVGPEVKQALKDLIAEGVIDADSLENAVKKIRSQDTRRRKLDLDFFGADSAVADTTHANFF